MDARDLTGWAPIRLDWRPPEPSVEWAYLGRRRFTAPFFSETVESLVQHPFGLLFRLRTPLSFLQQWREETPGLMPSGFIFHFSRCGSTLIAQAFAALPRCVVISEGDPISSVLNVAGPTPDDPRRIALLRDVISALGQRRSDEESFYVIKMEYRDIFNFTTIRTAFPNVPWIFVYRDPVEVMVSQFRSLARNMFPGAIEPRFLGVDPSMLLAMSPEEHSARCLGAIGEAALRALDAGGGSLVPYRSLPEALWTTIPDHFGVSLSGPDRDLLHLAARFDAKSRSLRFEPDSLSKRNAASEAIRRASDLWARPTFERLEARYSASERT